MPMSAKIIPLSAEYTAALAVYMHKKFPLYSRKYILFNIEEAINSNKETVTSFIVLDDNLNIVGCHLSFSTKAWIQNKEVTAIWGHDTYLDSEYRRELGMDLVLGIAAYKYGFGMGLTDINTKIQKLIRSNIFVDGVRKYCVLSPWIIWRKAQSFLKISTSAPSLPPTIHLAGNIFIKCQSPKDILIPNNGYWDKGICEVDFIRDEEFLNKRFFQNPVHHYNIYTLKDVSCYFVLRPILFKGVYALMVVDYRYDNTKPEQIGLIFKAAQKVCNQKRLGAILFTTSDKNVKSLFDNNKLCRSYPVAFVGGKKNITSKDSIVYLTAADSDDEYHK